MGGDQRDWVRSIVRLRTRVDRLVLRLRLIAIGGGANRTAATRRPVRRRPAHCGVRASVGERQLSAVLGKYTAHYNGHRPLRVLASDGVPGIFPLTLQRDFAMFCAVYLGYLRLRRGLLSERQHFLLQMMQMVD